MICLYTSRLRRALLLVLVLPALPACAAFDRAFGPEQEAKIQGLQRETRRVSRANAATQNAVKDLYQKIDTLENRLDELDQEVQEIADRDPILITPGGSGGSGLSSTLEEAERETPEEKAPEPEPEERTPVSEPVPTKRADLKKTPPKTDTASDEKEPAAKSEYDKAYAAYQDGRYDEALALFKAFLEEHPAHDLSDNAHYWIGEIYYDIDNFPEAILAFKEVATRFPQANKAPHALLKIGYAYVALDDPDNARTFLKRVIKNYPFSDAEAMARAKLKELENLR